MTPQLDKNESMPSARLVGCMSESFSNPKRFLLGGVSYFVVVAIGGVSIGAQWDFYPDLTSWLWIMLGPVLDTVPYKYGALDDMGFWVGNVIQLMLIIIFVSTNRKWIKYIFFRCGKLGFKWGNSVHFYKCWSSIVRVRSANFT